MEKARVPEKHLFLLYCLCESLDCVDHNKLWKILKEMGIPDHLTCLLRDLHAGQEATVRTGHRTTDWFQIGKWVHQGCILSPCYLTYMQSTSWKMLGWRNTSWNQDCQEKYQSPQICRWHHSYDRKQRGAKKPLDESERGEQKVGLKLNIQKMKIIASSPITSQEVDGEESGNSVRLYFWGLQNHCRWWLQPWN